MWSLNTMYFSLISVHVAVAAAFTINLPNQANNNFNEKNEVRNIKIFKDSDLYLNVVGFDAILERSLQRKVLEYTLIPLTNLGDNWASTLQELEVKVIDSNDANQIETLNLVCKIANPTSNLYAGLEFEKETHFYENIIPAIQHFEEIENVPQIERINKSFPQFFGSKLHVNSSVAMADSNTVLLFENLKFSNYTPRDRRSRLNKDEIKATLKKVSMYLQNYQITLSKVLAKMHALSISLRRKQPEIFNLKISPYLQTGPWPLIAIYLKIIVDEVRSVLTNYSEKVLAAIEQQAQPGAEYLLKKHPENHTPYTTICHRDLWITNVLFKNPKYFTKILDNTEVDGEIQVKLIDFQLYRYESFANDLIYFLLINAQLDDLRTDFRSFIEYYHLEFTKTLKYVNFPLNDYTYDKMWNEIKQMAKLHLVRVLGFIKVQSAVYSGSIPKSEQKNLIQYFIKQPASYTVLIQWKCIIDLFIENQFI